MKYKMIIKHLDQTLLETQIEAPTIMIAVHGVTNLLSMLEPDPTSLVITAETTKLAVAQ